ncbi:unnamed protein product [Dovyalis caffra]|uniref:NB-ARC domain-containing protein n=1 Tax=Dovyalis caffra TaxID=77055 RepID=A0AAV1SHI6_9ROSI|nr:unnamed protein product [Dovyalis caffra]
MSTLELNGIIKKFLKESRYMIVLDDVLHAKMWGSLKYALPQNTYSSRVMLTSHSIEIAFRFYTESKNKAPTLEIVEGFEKEKDGKTLEEVTENYLNELRSRSLMQVSKLVRAKSDFSLKRSLGGAIRLLGALELRGVNLEKFSNEVFRLYHLRYLSLRETEVRVNPTSVRKLQKLET